MRKREGIMVYRKGGRERERENDKKGKRMREGEKERKRARTNEDQVFSGPAKHKLRSDNDRQSQIGCRLYFA